MKLVDPKVEAARRDRCWDARERWAALQEFLTWAERQQPSPRNDPAVRRREEARKRRRLGMP